MTFVDLNPTAAQVGAAGVGNPLTANLASAGFAITGQGPSTSALNYTGPWSGSTSYGKNDVVGNPAGDGTMSICVLPHTNHTPPNATYWLPWSAAMPAAAYVDPGPVDAAGSEITLDTVRIISLTANTNLSACFADVFTTSAAHPCIRSTSFSNSDCIDTTRCSALSDSEIVGKDSTHHAVNCHADSGSTINIGNTCSAHGGSTLGDGVNVVISCYGCAGATLTGALTNSVGIGPVTVTGSGSMAIGNSLNTSAANIIELGFSDATKIQISTAGINSLSGFGMAGAGAQAQQANTIGPATALRTFGFVATGGTLYADWTPAGTATQTANAGLMGPTSGSAATPTFRALVNSDLPIGSQFLTAATTANRTTVSGTLSNVTDLSLSLLAGATYEFEAHLSVNASAVTGNQYGVNFSAAGATLEAQISGTLAANTMQAQRISALNTATSTFDTAGADGGIWITGRITTTTNAGNLTIQHLVVVATTTTATVYAGSSLTARRVA